MVPAHPSRRSLFLRPALFGARGFLYDPIPIPVPDPDPDALVPAHRGSGGFGAPFSKRDLL